MGTERAAVDLEKLIEEARRQQWEQTPEHIKELGRLLRESTVSGELDKLAAFLVEQKVGVSRDQLESFRDYLIITRIDLKDLEPAARERLRAQTLARENPQVMSPDYMAATAQGEIPKCRNCRWFVKPPMDGSEHGDKPCVNFGTKGSDVACYGFTSTSN